MLADDSLLVHATHGGTTTEFTVPLKVLSDGSTRSRQPGTKSLPALIVFSAMFLPSLAGAIMFDRDTRVMCATFAVITAVPVLISAFRMWKDSFDIVVFFNRFNGEPVFNLFHAKPNPEEFRAFVGEITKRIKQAGLESEKPEDSSSIPQQIQGFARLRDQGILTQEEFDKIKARLLGSLENEPKRIGFQ